jgi:DNA-binding transcriptional regulator YdaS (Cro superfamily)
MGVIFGGIVCLSNKSEVEFKFNLWFNRSMNTQTQTALQRAVDLSGGVASLAKACDVSLQAVYKWLHKGYPPLERCEAIERAVGGKVTRFDLLPPTFSANASETDCHAPSV